MRYFLLSASVVAISSLSVGAQTPARKEPFYYAGGERASRAEARPPGLRLGLRPARVFALAPLSDAESARLSEPDSKLRIGVHRRIAEGALGAGAWQTTADGTSLWRMSVRSPGSTGVRLEFDRFSAGAGRLWLYGGDQVDGPYTGRGPFEDGHFWSATIFSESVTLEYEPADGASVGGNPPFELGSLSHQADARPAGGFQVFDTYTPLPNPEPSPEAGFKDPADVCHLDPNCYPEWKDAMKMVAQITYEDSGLSYLCSGSLVTTRDNSLKPYLLTAGHCIHSEASARTLEVYWTYQTSTCGGAPPQSRKDSAKSSPGGHLIGSGSLEEGDYSLVLLKDIPKDVWFAGWDMADPPATTPLVGLHHPSGSYKRISFGERVGDMSAMVGDSLAPSSRYLEVLWNKGTTEHGSSGSPLFSSPGVIVGMLSYGPSSPYLTPCQISPTVDGYGRFSNAYTPLKDYLENLPAAAVVPQAGELRFQSNNAAAPPAQKVQLTTESTGKIAFKLRADAPWILVSPVSGTLSAGSPATVEIAIDPAKFDRSGRYSSTVTVLSGAAPPRFVNVTADASADRSNVKVSISPDPVYQTNGLWTLTIRLQDTGGAATRFTAFKLNGRDFSSGIAEWFGGDAIAAGGALQANLQSDAAFPAGDQYFEFWGVDTATGQPWYRSVAVSFVPQP